MHFNIDTFLWCKTEKNDKIWGWITVGTDDGTDLYNFWGRRSDSPESLKKIKFKKHLIALYAHENMAFNEKIIKDFRENYTSQKLRKGYNMVANSDIESVYPGFIDHAKKSLMYAKLSNTVIVRK